MQGLIEQVKATRLENGLTVLTDFMPAVRSATVGIWVRRGSRHEQAELNGISHFIEHAVFKGTHKRTALDIATETDRLGGHLDAFTSQGVMGFTMKVRDTALRQAFDLLSDIVANPRFDEEDLEREKRVIIEEMKMVEDTPDEYLMELFNAAYFPNHPLGRPIEGTEKTVSSFNHAKTSEFHKNEFSAKNLIVAAAGNVKHDELVELATKVFSDNKSEDTFGFSGFDAPQAATPILLERKEGLEQAHLIIATPFPSATDEERYAASLLSNVLGGGTSSRLWQSIREERGLAYTIGAGLTAFEDTGVFNAYAGTSPEQLDEVVDLSLEEIRRAVRERVPDDELQLAKDQTVSSILLSLESSGMRAGALVRSEMLHGRYISSDEVIEKIEAVTPDDLQQLAQKFFTTEKMSLGALGDLDGFKVDRARLEI
jgi:predicted Zn-dependent peptidase